MRILHTADFHLKEYGDTRWESLDRLIEVGEKEGVQLFLISGDLFDKEVNAENLRPRLREIFSGRGFKILIIPGNHDREAYEHGMWFGEDVIVLTDLYRPFEYQNVRIWGMPFEPIEGEAILQRLRSLSNDLADNGKNILLFHGELLDAFFSRRDFGDEDGERYMPVKLSYFKSSGIDYVLAGHFHSRMNSWSLENGGYFVYPGSPVSITKREVGRRKANLFEVGKPPCEYLLDTPHFEEVVLEFSPLKDENPMKMIEERVKNLHEEARIILTVRGFIDGKAIGMDERMLVEEIRKATRGRLAEEHFEFRDVQAVLEDDLTRRFIQKLEQAGYEAEKENQIRDLVIHAIIQSRR
ncbi:MAG: DNA repair exonuclease [Proteobacteria bacterium]|nr:DNA repair exonuclease [Pseudomonadota bacterium]NIS72682.1 DNA repair exonuclease [Pseudomonadota bacterium]